MHKALFWLEQLKLSKNSRILEVGVGTGRLTKEVALRGYNILGVDYSYGMLEKAFHVCNYENQSKVEFLKGDIESLPIKNSSFDVIICLGVITYIKSDEKAFHELARLLKPGGTLILSFVNKARLIKNLDLPILIKNTAKKLVKRTKIVRENNINTQSSITARTYLIPYIRKSLTSAGLTMIGFEAITLDLFTLCGKETLPRKISIPISQFIDRLSSIPIVDSFGGMCIINAQKSIF
jgi:ubiquinone/menaquinone biosynthesis C-methylase UbiE